MISATRCSGTSSRSSYVAGWRDVGHAEMIRAGWFGVNMTARVEHQARELMPRRARLIRVGHEPSIDGTIRSSVALQSSGVAPIRRSAGSASTTVDTTRTRVGSTRIKVHSTWTDVNPIRTRVDAIRTRVDAIRMRVDAIRMRVDAIRMKVDPIRMRVD